MPQAAQTSVMVISVTGFASMASTTAFWMAFLVAAASAMRALPLPDVSNAGSLAHGRRRTDGAPLRDGFGHEPESTSRQSGRFPSWREALFNSCVLDVTKVVTQ